MKDCILQATLKNGRLALMGSDLVSENGLIKGNSVSLTLNCNSEKEIRSCYKKLSAGITINLLFTDQKVLGLNPNAVTHQASFAEKVFLFCNKIT